MPTDDPMTSLTAHVIQTLQGTGFTDDDLSIVDFRGTRGPLSRWIVRYPIQWGSNPDAYRHCRLLSILRWLATEPRWSQNREAAYTELALFMLEPEIDAGRRHSEAQSRRASKPRGKLTEHGDPKLGDLKLGGVVDRLAREHRDESAKAVWTHFLSTLETLELRPVTRLSMRRDVQVEYDRRDGKGKRKTLTLRRFSWLLAKARAKEPLRPG